MGKAPKGFSQGKKKGKNKAKTHKKCQPGTPAEPNEAARDVEADLAPEVPPPPTRPPAGTPAAKPRPVAELSPGSQDTFRLKKRESAARTLQRQKAEAAAPPVELPASPYSRTKAGKKRGGGQHAKGEAKRRDLGVLTRTLDSLGDESHQAQLLMDLSEHKSKGRVAAAAGYTPAATTQAALFAMQQTRDAMVRAHATAKRGRTSDDKRSFIMSNLTAQAPDADSVDVPSLRVRARATGLPVNSARRLLTKATTNRALLFEGEARLSWSLVEARKGYTKITSAVKAALHAWVLNHPRVVNSPIANETLLVKNPATGEVERVSKLLGEISIREMHNDLIALPISQGGPGGGLAEARDAKGKIIISDSALRYLLPAQLKAMTEKHKQMCGCETCLVPDSHQRTLNAWRARRKRTMCEEAAALPPSARNTKAVAAARAYQPTLNMTPPSPWHSKPGLALGEIQCAPCAGIGLPHWDCVLRRCVKCPKYKVPWEEQGTDLAAPTIKFHVYETATVCTRHGSLTPGAKVCNACATDPAPATQKKRPKVSSRKKLTLRECSIGIFHEEYYLPALEKFAYHRPHCRILGKDQCGKERLAAYKRRPSVRTRRDYAERLAAAFNLEAQHEHFGNGRSLSMEGSSVETFVRAAVDAWRAGDPGSGS